MSPEKKKQSVTAASKIIPKVVISVPEETLTVPDTIPTAQLMDKLTNITTPNITTSNTLPTHKSTERVKPQNKQQETLNFLNNAIDDIQKRNMPQNLSSPSWFEPPEGNFNK